MTTFVLIDQDRYDRRATEERIADALRAAGLTRDVAFAPSMSFVEALERRDWRDIDVAIVDLAESLLGYKRLGDAEALDAPTSDQQLKDHYLRLSKGDEHYGAMVARHLRRCVPKPTQQLSIVVVTSQEGSYSRDSVRRRLKDDEIDAFIHRNNLELLLPRMVRECGRLEHEISTRKDGDRSRGYGAKSRVGEMIAVGNEYGFDDLSTGTNRRAHERIRGELYRRWDRLGAILGGTSGKWRTMQRLMHDARKIRPEQE